MNTTSTLIEWLLMGLSFTAMTALVMTYTYVFVSLVEQIKDNCNGED